ncbi:MAG: hypothetical protein WBF33_39040 [Candidatus Nitrosopolaris sp.]
MVLTEIRLQNLMDELSTLVTSQPHRDTRSTNFIDIGRIRLNGKKQKDVYALKSLFNDNSKYPPDRTDRTP